jgi:hypothetical protein
LKIKLDGESIMAMMGSTSEKMYLCQVPSFWVRNDKAETGRVTCTRRESRCSVSVCVNYGSCRCRLDDRGPFNWSHASSWVSFALGKLIPE